MESPLNEQLGFRKQEMMYFWTGFLENPKFFENLLLTVLLKIEWSLKYKNLESSPFYCLKTINLILRKLKVTTLIQKYRRQINLCIYKLASKIDNLVIFIHKHYQQDEIVSIISFS